MKLLKIFLFPACCLAGAFLSGSPARAEAPQAILDSLVNRPGFWESPSLDLEQELKPMGFEWTSAAKDSLRAAHPGISVSGQRAYEAIVRFAGDKPESVTVIFYNRGDAGDLSRPAFDSLLDGVTTSLSALYGAPPVERGRDVSGAVKADGVFWKNDNALGTLEWSATKESQAKGIAFRAEFIRLIVTTPRVAAARVGATPPPSVKDIVKSFSGRDHIEKSPAGDVFLAGVPMVDQGDKGYCVVASVERVMRYFGAPVDQHELAQIANTATEGGTSPTAMMDSLKKLTMRLGVRVKEVYPFDFSDFMKMIDDYNRLAKREKKEPVDTGGRIVDIGKCYDQMDPEILKAVRIKKAADFGKFQREIQRSVDEGLPLLWSMRLGIVPETGIPQIGGGHMRLIVGYNAETKEILYSDSWGMGHEKKRMAMEDAWTITTGLSIIQPIST
jgi:hypothetical protein